jgi:D-alanyl-D-alanine carboxypeptidase (penicillin-binding protein 5/6)
MTAYAVFHALRDGKLKLDTEVPISERAWRSEGSRTYLDLNTRVPVEVLIQGMIVQSGNDATIALAEAIAGTEDTFAALMNQYAERLGMRQSHFQNSTGLPGTNHQMSAADIARLTRAIIGESTTAGTRSANSPGTTSASRTAMACWSAIQAWTASRPA